VVSVGPTRIIVREGSEARVQQLTSSFLQRVALAEPPWEESLRYGYYNGYDYEDYDYNADVQRRQQSNVQGSFLLQGDRDQQYNYERARRRNPQQQQQREYAQEAYAPSPPPPLRSQQAEEQPLASNQVRRVGRCRCCATASSVCCVRITRNARGTDQGGKSEGEELVVACGRNSAGALVRSADSAAARAAS
jgi:hypothetical protein